MIRLARLLAAILVCASPEAAAADGIEAHAAWARAAVGTAAAAYVTLRNTGAAPARLIGAESTLAQRIELHESAEQDGIVRMRRLDWIEIAPGATVALAPRGKHLMLLDLARPLAPGSRFDLRLRFAGGGTIAVEVAVGTAGAVAPPADDRHRH